ncbi:DUF202 domain-containing protein [Arthrobacter koreensis]|uniref:DUF202 domain-containing protein n=1 Tax=Arthrobacter koreensis TaxID=199136 RepID=UPI002DBABA3B|nr:DUF202 domain-containing protein [Arthrobacter koreensis]MEB7449184.1 DUF202 domain-containing protein [Arthrobacter koreensis]
MAGVHGHGDPGLQPERTSLAWSRTSLALVVASAMFLRWLPTHGWYAVSLVFSALVLAIAINSTQRRRYGRGSATIRQEAGRASVGAVLALAVAVVALSAVGIVAVLVLPVP